MGVLLGAFFFSFLLVVIAFVITKAGKRSESSQQPRLVQSASSPAHPVPTDPARPYLDGDAAAAIVERAKIIEDLPDGKRSVQELVAEHTGWERRPQRQEQSSLGAVTFYESTPAEDHSRLLGRLATKLKFSDMTQAIACLKRQGELAAGIGRGTIAEQLRLPLFLQQSGRMPEAVMEFEKLIARTNIALIGSKMAEKESGYLHADLRTIYEKLALAHRRAGDAERAEIAEAEAVLCGQRHSEWLQAEEKRRKAATARREAERAARSRPLTPEKREQALSAVQEIHAMRDALPPAQATQSAGQNEPWPEAVAGWMMMAREAFAAGSIDDARLFYQKAAYGFTQLTDWQNEELKREIANFAQHDPSYLAGLALVREVVSSAPGVLQSELGKASGEQREALNYVLYFAALTGDLVRVKFGRSYALYLPGQPMPPAVPKAPRKRRAKSDGTDGL